MSDWESAIWRNLKFHSVASQRGYGEKRVRVVRERGCRRRQFESENFMLSKPRKAPGALEQFRRAAAGPFGQ
jgi:hypothetical protein